MRSERCTNAISHIDHPCNADRLAVRAFTCLMLKTWKGMTLFHADHLLVDKNVRAAITSFRLKCDASRDRSGLIENCKSVVRVKGERGQADGTVQDVFVACGGCCVALTSAHRIRRDGQLSRGYCGSNAIFPVNRDLKSCQLTFLFFEVAVTTHTVKL